MSVHEYTGSTSSHIVAMCKHSPRKAFQLDGVSYYGATGSDRASLNEKMVYVGLALATGYAGSTTYWPIITAKDQKYKDLEILCMKAPEPVVVVDWPDYGFPPLANTFWQALHDKLKENAPKDAAGIAHVTFYCVGGHGRTGTALAAMAIAVAGQENGEAIELVREIYCSQAVESIAQEKYLEVLDFQINGRPILTDTADETPRGAPSSAGFQIDEDSFTGDGEPSEQLKEYFTRHAKRGNKRGKR